MNRISFLLLLLLLLFLPSVLYASAAMATSNNVYISASTWGSQTSPIQVEPGSMTQPFSIYITNPNLSAITDVFVTLNLSFPFSTPTHGVVLGPITMAYGNASYIPPGSSAPVIFYLNISPKGADGVYMIPARVNYTISNTNYTFTDELQIPVTTYASLRAQNAYWGTPAQPSLANAGLRNGNLVIDVQNLGDNTAYNASISIYPSSPFYYSKTSETTYMGVIPAGGVVPAQFTLSINPSTPTGLYPLVVSLSYNNGETVNQTINVPITGSPNVIIQNYGVGAPGIFPGNQNVPITVDLVNSGNVTANNVGVYLQTQSPLQASYPGSTSIEIGSMPPGQPIPTTFYVDVLSDISSPAPFNVTLQISYGGSTYSHNISLQVDGQANFSATTYNNAYLEQGASNTAISLLIKNAGNITAKSTQVQLLLPNEFSGTTVDYLGDMQRGATNIATFSLAVSSSAAVGTYHGTMVITWFQNNAPGSQFTQEIPISLQVHQGLYGVIITWLSGVGWLVVAIVVLVIIIAVITALFLRRRR